MFRVNLIFGFNLRQKVVQDRLSWKLGPSPERSISKNSLEMSEGDEEVRQDLILLVWFRKVSDMSNAGSVLDQICYSCSSVVKVNEIWKNSRSSRNNHRRSVFICLPLNLAYQADSSSLLQQLIIIIITITTNTII